MEWRCGPWKGRASHNGIRSIIMMTQTHNRGSFGNQILGQRANSDPGFGPPCISKRTAVTHILGFAHPGPGSLERRYFQYAVRSRHVVQQSIGFISVHPPDQTSHVQQACAADIATVVLRLFTCFTCPAITVATVTLRALDIATVVLRLFLYVSPVRR